MAAREKRLRECRAARRGGVSKKRGEVWCGNPIDDNDNLPEWKRERKPGTLSKKTETPV